MTSSFRSRQAGEGKAGCFGSLVFVGLLAAVGIKAIPVYYSNTELVKACNDDIAPEASRYPEEAIVEQVRAKAKSLEIPEALKAGAVTVHLAPSSGDNPGNVRIILRYSRPVDFYGVYTYTFVTEETIDRTIYTNIR